MTYVVDASVVIKWLVREEGSEQAARLMTRPVAAPELLIPECVNALWSKVVRGMLLESDAEIGARVLRTSGIALEPMQPLAADILDLSLRLKHSAYDCTYLALARSLDGVLVTADRRLLARCMRPDAADLAGHVRSLDEVGYAAQEPRPRKYGYRVRPAA
jgi:predicted nucleic acid-binding protein